MGLEKLKPIEEVIKKITEENNSMIDYYKKKQETDIAQAMQNRVLAANLIENGIHIPLYNWDTLRYLNVSLGEVPETKKKKKEFVEKLRTIRKVLGCPIKLYTKNLDDARRKTVRMTLRAEGYPGLSVDYVTKLPKNAKCQIVKTRKTQSQLVCGV